MTGLPKRLPTISQVAQAAGVSRATVSRTFSRPDLLKPETIKRVHEVAEKIGYVPNQVARALSTGRAGNIALVVPDIANPFFPPLIRAAQARADHAGYAVFLGDSDEQPEREDMLLTKMAAQVEGFILASPRLDEERVRAHAARRPLVLINRDIEGLPRILMDVSVGIAAAIEHLASLNHRHIAYVSGPPASWANQQRQQAAVRTAEKLGIHLTTVPAYHPNHEAGRKAAGELAQLPVTATIAFDDLVAQGIMAGLADLGWRIPQEMSIVGFDDVLAATTYPPLTTVAAHSADAGTQAVKLLTEVLSRGQIRDECIIIPTELIVRATTDQPTKRPRTASAEPRSETRTESSQQKPKRTGRR
ncbi:LacI family DNA-binding transcriptional regulator [Microvirga rosea]|uniref:LacI family DNA-binding transcriptional regulator n=1 Tax=Microvirga rosea TaxID=2715425 RepID=UPI001D0A165F|nr:LacI family DNA-binding transcriptional regulator [Microvirga rosea]MCB8823332.1 LacI family transcriptional regulator [Microvirga rosea]